MLEILKIELMIRYNKLYGLTEEEKELVRNFK